MQFEHDLITKRIGNYFFLTSRGKKACKVGGWEKLKKIDNRNKLIKRILIYSGIIAGLLFGLIQTLHLFSKGENKTININTEIEFRENQEIIKKNQNSDCKIDSMKNDKLK